MRKFSIVVILTIVIGTNIGCSKTNKNDYEIENNTDKIEQSKDEENREYEIEKQIIEKYSEKIPTKWGEKLDKVINNIDTSEREIALTFDACGGEYGSGYDKELIDYLIKENIKATLFVNYRWIESNKDTFLELARNPLFEIENHGYSHRPLSVTENSIYNIEGTNSIQEVINEIKLNEKAIYELTGIKTKHGYSHRPLSVTENSIYNIEGTNSIQEVINEIKLNEKAIYELTGIKTKHFRSGTAYYDEVAINIAEDLGYKIAGYSINGDGGATFSKGEVEDSLKQSKSGDIVICHFNQPNKETFEGLKDILLTLKNEGYKFIRLDKK